MSSRGPVRLSLVLDAVAALRQRRLARQPDPLAIALLAEQAGADGVTLRLRADRAEAQERDVERVAKAAPTRLNLRVAPSAELLDVADRTKPAQCCLVPEQRHDHAAGGGLDAVALRERLAQARGRLHEAGIEVAARIDPVIEQIDACAQAGLDAVELHCGAYALATDHDALGKRLSSLETAAKHAAAAGLTVYAGGGLDYRNVAPVVAVAEVVELRIGHAIVANALVAGIEAAVVRMSRLLERRRPDA